MKSRSIRKKTDRIDKTHLQNINDPFYQIAKFIAKKKFSQARRCAEKIGKKNKDGKFLCEVGVLFARMGRSSSANHMFKSALDITPEEPTVHYNYGLFLKGNKDLKAAEKEFRTAVKLDDTNANYYSMLGNTLLELGKVKSAEKEFKTAIYLEPKNLFALTGLGNLAIKNGDLKEAEIIFKRIIKLDKKYPVPYLTLFLLYSEQGREKDAKKIKKSAEKVNLKISIDKNKEY
jgi:Flp pilus assembly protein TadD